MQVAEDEDRETEDDLDEEDEEYDSGGSGVAMTPPGACSCVLLVNDNRFLKRRCSQCWEWSFMTDLVTVHHPDSPGAGRRHLAKKNSVVEGLIDPERDIYAIPSQVVTVKLK